MNQESHNLSVEELNSRVKSRLFEGVHRYTDSAKRNFFLQFRPHTYEELQEQKRQFVAKWDSLETSQRNALIDAAAKKCQTYTSQGTVSILAKSRLTLEDTFLKLIAKWSEELTKVEEPSSGEKIQVNGFVMSGMYLTNLAVRRFMPDAHGNPDFSVSVFSDLSEWSSTILLNFLKPTFAEHSMSADSNFFARPFRLSLFPAVTEERYAPIALPEMRADPGT